MESKPRIIIDLGRVDGMNAVRLAKKLDPEHYALLLPLHLAFGETLIFTLQQVLGFKLVLDLQLLNSPSIVSHCVQTANNFGAWMVTVNPIGGRSMLNAALQVSKERADKGKRTTLICSHIPPGSITHGMEWLLERDSMPAHLAAISHEAGINHIICPYIEMPKAKSSVPDDVSFIASGLTGRAAEDAAYYGADSVLIEGEFPIEEPGLALWESFLSFKKGVDFVASEGIRNAWSPFL